MIHSENIHNLYKHTDYVVSTHYKQPLPHLSQAVQSHKINSSYPEAFNKCHKVAYVYKLLQGINGAGDAKLSFLVLL